MKMDECFENMKTEKKKKLDTSAELELYEGGDNDKKGGEGDQKFSKSTKEAGEKVKNIFH